MCTCGDKAMSTVNEWHSASVSPVRHKPVIMRRSQAHAQKLQLAIWSDYKTVQLNLFIIKFLYVLNQMLDLNLGGGLMQDSRYLCFVCGLLTSAGFFGSFFFISCLALSRLKLWLLKTFEVIFGLSVIPTTQHNTAWSDHAMWQNSRAEIDLSGSS